MEADIQTRSGTAWVEDLAAALAAELATAAAAEPVLFAIAGGSTPAPVLAALADHVDWSRVRAVPSDERVTDDDAYCNRAMIARALDGRAVHDLARDPPLRAPDVALIGFGGDRHVASVFPAGAHMDVARRLDSSAPLIVRATPDPLPPEAPFARITFTLAALVAAPVLFIAARGAEKRAVFDAAMAEAPPTSPLALLVDARSRAGRGTRVWFDLAQ